MRKPDVNARIIKWLLLLQRFDFTIVDKPGRENLVAEFLSRMNLPVGEEEMVDDQFLDEHLFSISVLSPWFVDIANYLVSAQFSPNLLSRQKKQDNQERCPLHLGWGKSIQTRPRSNLEKMCEGGEGL